jgi:hypothetical protein
MIKDVNDSYQHQAMRGARDMLKEAAKQFRLNKDDGHANMCEIHRQELQAAITLDLKEQNDIVGKLVKRAYG